MLVHLLLSPEVHFCPRRLRSCVGKRGPLALALGQESIPLNLKSPAETGFLLTRVSVSDDPPCQDVYVFLCLSLASLSYYCSMKHSAVEGSQVRPELHG